jgi:hypothetical protein
MDRQQLALFDGVMGAMPVRTQMMRSNRIASFAS